ncbi:VOC family protein [Mesorhizobium amorphae]|uniref:VOC family protein n=1 Tax=Mesorhizobium amorphae TaxID=71433 RepID=UPI0028CB8F62|nr:VOC family protein [Mesorhizobium amorphae]
MMHTAANMQRPVHPLDHIVLPTATLEGAEARLTTLGFTVAPHGVHPFGTENCCVYLADGTFLEPLAVGDAEIAAQAIMAGNVFVARDHTYREDHGAEGFSAIVFGTDDADHDHRAYVEAGISAGEKLDFSRPFTDRSGKSDTVSFRLAFASGRDTPDAFVFACQRINAPKVDRAALQVHANGATAIQGIVAVSDDPALQRALLTKAAARGKVSAQPDGLLVLPNADVAVMRPDEFEAEFSIGAGGRTALRFAAVIFAWQIVARQNDCLFRQASGTICRAAGLSCRPRRARVQPSSSRT